MPRDIVNNFETLLLKSHADRINVVERSANPNRAVQLENFFAKTNPASIEFVLILKRRKFIPFALVYRSHFAAFASYAAVR